MDCACREILLWFRIFSHFPACWFP